VAGFAVFKMTLQWIWLHLVIGHLPFPGWARVFMPCCSLPQAGSGTILAAASVKNGLTDFLSSMAASADVLALAKIEVCCQKLLSWGSGARSVGLQIPLSDRR
jgi:hypothetical protein